MLRSVLPLVAVLLAPGLVLAQAVDSGGISFTPTTPPTTEVSIILGPGNCVDQSIAEPTGGGEPEVVVAGCPSPLQSVAAAKEKMAKFKPRYGERGLCSDIELLTHHVKSHAFPGSGPLSWVTDQEVEEMINGLHAFAKDNAIEKLRTPIPGHGKFQQMTGRTAGDAQGVCAALGTEVLPGEVAAASIGEQFCNQYFLSLPLVLDIKRSLDPSKSTAVIEMVFGKWSNTRASPAPKFTDYFSNYKWVK